LLRIAHSFIMPKFYTHPPSRASDETKLYDAL
jgi:hypothetical protein